MKAPVLLKVKKVESILLMKGVHFRLGWCFLPIRRPEKVFLLAFFLIENEIHVVFRIAGVIQVIDLLTAKEALSLSHSGAEALLLISASSSAFLGSEFGSF